jgi:hypothetical protein
MTAGIVRPCNQSDTPRECQPYISGDGDGGSPSPASVSSASAKAGGYFVLGCFVFFCTCVFPPIAAVNVLKRLGRDVCDYLPEVGTGLTSLVRQTHVIHAVVTRKTRCDEQPPSP